MTMLDSDSNQKMSPDVPDISVPPRVLASMFWLSTIMAALCLLVAVVWLIAYQFFIFQATQEVMRQAPDTFYPDFVLKNQMQALLIQTTPISCGTLAGVGFGFLGFAIVSLNLKSTIGMEGEYEKAKLKFINLSPGILIILVAAILIGFSISRYQSYVPKVFENWQPTASQSQ